MSNIVTSVSFRYIDPRHKEPGPSREFINQNILLPPGAHLPRMGEAIELMHWDLNRDMKSGVYSVLFVHTRIALFDGNDKPSGWHTTITVGPQSDEIDERFLTAPS
ncbi:hypothetical protein JAB6_19030 [Janthinobacterium sp. HH104]|uniref:hypothetical protein n=1 Tax=unclassified Janthinobacterium TaxID=2610881 RepID=UPI0008746899|nr:hypothetical protein [Janthinobacterium sp. HH104]OEZ85056.1 hypothetical protein JAB6_19030 [Janthinobacterium sp. HH104]